MRAIDCVIVSQDVDAFAGVSLPTATIHKVQCKTCKDSPEIVGQLNKGATLFRIFLGGG